MGAEQVEVHCHGGVAAPAAVLDGLAALGCQVVDWQTWLAECEPSLIRAEAARALTESTTRRTAAILVDQHAGSLDECCRQIDELLAAGQIAGARALVGDLLDRAPLGLHLTQPWRVVLAGPPNVGKSSLINALLGFSRAIVHDAPGTTRDVVTAATSLDGWPLELADTAGLRSTDNPLEAAGIELAEAQMSAADVIVLVFDIRQELDPAMRTLAERWPEAIVVANKSDLAPQANAQQSGAIATSALTAAGVGELRQVLVARLVPAEPAIGTAIPFTVRQVECLRRIAATLDVGDVRGAQAAVAQLTGSERC
jgi:tRNA modification GTPase